MRIQSTLLATFLACSPIANAASTAVDLSWLDGFLFRAENAITDINDVPLSIRDVIQVGYFNGVDPNKDPQTYTQADWDSFTPLTGDGSLNPPPGSFGSSIIGAGGAPAGYFTFNVTLDDTLHTGVPTSDVRIGLRFFDDEVAANASNFNTVSGSEVSWILPTAVEFPLIVFPKIANLDTDILSWEGTPFDTDLVPGAVAPNLVLTSVNLLSPATLQISWTGGDGSNIIETSTNGENFTTVSTGASSPAIIVVTPGSVPNLLVRVVEP
ncbi:MAG: hypothetical protein ACKJSK_01450 [Roseibacillus sp.]